MKKNEKKYSFNNLVKSLENQQMQKKKIIIILNFKSQFIAGFPMIDKNNSN